VELDCWIQQTEGAKFWSGVLTELRNRGLRDALFVCCDGLTGLPAAVNAVWPAAVVQTCVVHLIRASMRYVSWSDRKAMTAALRPIYTAPTVQAAELAFGAFKDEWSTRAAGAVAAWERAWEEFTPFLAFAPEIRKVIYTTNLIESINFQLRRPLPHLVTRPYLSASLLSTRAPHRSRLWWAAAVTAPPRTPRPRCRRDPSIGTSRTPRRAESPRLLWCARRRRPTHGGGR
jgi:mutator family transposase